MTTMLDLVYVALFAIVAPLIDYAVFWPIVHRRLARDPAAARRWVWAWSTWFPWVWIAVGTGLWAASDRSWQTFGFSVPEGWRLWASGALVALAAAYHTLGIATVARSAEVRASVRQQGAAYLGLLPHTRGDLVRFCGVSLTAGFCEEFLYRGYFVAVLAPWLGWWGSAALSLPLFALGHRYQGWSGVVRTGVMGAVFTLIVGVSGSLWPAIAVHALHDVSAGIVAWLALRED